MSIGVSHHDPGFLRRNVGIGLGPEANMWSQCNCSQNVSMVQRVVSFQMGKRRELFGLLLTALLIRGSVLFTSGEPPPPPSSCCEILLLLRATQLSKELMASWVTAFAMLPFHVAEMTKCIVTL